MTDTPNLRRPPASKTWLFGASIALLFVMTSLAVWMWYDLDRRAQAGREWETTHQRQLHKSIETKE